MKLLHDGNCMRLLAALCLTFAAIPLAAANDESGAAWLKKMAQAAHKQNYSGTFVHQRGNQIDSLRVLHTADHEGEMLQLEAQDGTPRRLLRHNGEAYCILPGNPPVAQSAQASRRIFPALLPDDTDALLSNYRIRLDGTDRVAGQPCQIVLLEPRDQYRYGYSFCAAIPGGLMLKASLLEDSDENSDQFAFSELSLDPPSETTRRALKSEWQGHDRMQIMPAPVLPQETHWQINHVPDGFRLVSAVQRMMPGRPQPVSHLVYSDSLATVSVFIELPRKNVSATERPIRTGVTGAYIQTRFQHQITAMGEVPSATLMQFVNNVAPR